VRVPFHRRDQPGARERARGRQPGSPADHPRGVPNVLYVVWDDASIALWSAFGGLAETPTMKWLAGRGLRYSQWHTNALPSVTRSCLLTGRNGASADREQSVIIPREAGTLAEILGRNGYRTYCVGQWHHSPQPAATAAANAAAPVSAARASARGGASRRATRVYSSFSSSFFLMRFMRASKPSLLMILLNSAR